MLLKGLPLLLLIALPPARAADFCAAFSPPAVVGSSDLTHFWFPAGVARLRNGSGSTILQHISRSGDGKRCPPPEHPSYPCAATMDSRDGGLTYEACPPAGPFPLLPTSPLETKSAATPTNFSSLNAIKCINASCTGQLVRWFEDHSPHALPGPRLNASAYLPLRVTGVPPQLLSATDGERPIMLRDGSILIPLYGFASDASLSCSKEMPHNRCYTVFFFRNPKPKTDPLAWEYVSRIDHTPAMSAHGAQVEGPCEPAVVQLPGADDRLLSVFRVGAYVGHWAALSSDGGRHWGAPFPTGTWAVSPNLLASAPGPWCSRAAAPVSACGSRPSPTTAGSATRVFPNGSSTMWRQSTTDTWRSRLSSTHLSTRRSRMFHPMIPAGLWTQPTRVDRTICSRRARRATRAYCNWMKRHCCCRTIG